MTDDDRVLTPSEVAGLLRVSEVTVRRLVRSGKLPRVAGLGSLLIPRAAVDRMLEGVYDVEPDGSPRAGDDRPDHDAGGAEADPPPTRTD